MRAVVNVSTGGYVKGQQRLTEWCAAHDEQYFIWNDASGLPAGCPSHAEVPYAMKAYALRDAIAAGAKTLLWCDASIKPIRDLGPLWERIEEKGYWIGNNGWTNYEWTADRAYDDLFPAILRRQMLGPRYYDAVTGDCKGDDGAPEPLEMRGINRTIPHVVAGAFGISMDHPTGRAIFEEYFRLASETKAFCGPWTNANSAEVYGRGALSERCQPCGPMDVLGHRHDQTALSVISWRLGCELTNSPNILSYAGGETENTFVVMDGAY